MNIYITIALSIYISFIIDNYFKFKEIMSKDKDSWKFKLMLLTGPYINIVLRKIKKQRIQKEKKEKINSLIKELPKMLKEYNIKIVDDNNKEINPKNIHKNIDFNELF